MDSTILHRGNKGLKISLRSSLMYGYDSIQQNEKCVAMISPPAYNLDESIFISLARL